MKTIAPKKPAQVENGAWRAVSQGWRQLYGDFTRRGLSVEDHAFQTSLELDWGRSFHEDSVELCLNLDGVGQVRDRQNQVAYGPRTIGFYCRQTEPLPATRLGQQAHTFITIEWSHAYLSEQLRGSEDGVHPRLRDWLAGKKRAVALSAVTEMKVAEASLAHALRRPPVAPAAFPLWYQSKITELMTQAFFPVAAPAEMFCNRLKRQAQERIERVVELLRGNLENPPDLPTLGRQVGCSPFYLSRTFSKEMGQTIPQYVRELRMRRAAELLRSGRFNVTEVALEVGYNSLSHFSAAFCQVTGCCPSLYPKAEHLIKPGF